MSNIRDDTTPNVSTASQSAPVYYGFGVASNLRRRVITTLPAIKAANYEQKKRGAQPC